MELDKSNAVKPATRGPSKFSKSAEKGISDILQNEEKIEPITVEPVINKEVIPPIDEDEQKDEDISSLSTEEVTTAAPISSIFDVQEIVNQNIIQRRAGKTKSIYFSADSVEILKKYCKENKIKNESKVIDSLVKNVLGPTLPKK